MAAAAESKSDIVFQNTSDTEPERAMVCIPCIVIPVLLWVYKKFLEPYLYPIISPFLKRIWSKKAVQEIPKEDQKTDMFESAMDESEISMTESSSVANGFAGSGPPEMPDKKMD